MLREHCPLGMFILKINRGGLCNVFRLKKILAFLFVTFKQYFTNRFKMMSVKRCFSVILSLCTVSSENIKLSHYHTPSSSYCIKRRGYKNTNPKFVIFCLSLRLVIFFLGLIRSRNYARGYIVAN